MDLDLVREAYRQGRLGEVTTKDFAMNDLNYAVALDVWYTFKKIEKNGPKTKLTRTERNFT